MRLAVIPARSGSKRAPTRSVIPFHGRPIIAWSIEAALKSGCFDEVIVSTDSDDVANVASEYGASVPFKLPGELFDDSTGAVPVIAHAVHWFRDRGKAVEEVCCIDATAPLIKACELREGLRLLVTHPCDYVFGATAFSHPIQRAFRVDDNMRASMFHPEFERMRSQDLEPAWHDAGQFYWGRAEAWLGNEQLFQGRSLIVPIPRSRVLDVDTPEDLERMEMLFSAAVAQERRKTSEIGGESLEETGGAKRFSLGTVQFGTAYGVANNLGQVSAAEAADLIRRAKSAGMRALDTAPAYGESETVLGRIGVSDWDVTTKLSAVPDSVPEVYPWMRSQIEDSLSRLGLDRVYGLLLHRPEQVLGPRGPELLAALDRLKQEGLVGKVGVSVYSPAQLEKLTQNARFDLVQAPCSILDQRLVQTGTAARLKEMGVELHARSVFLQGLLLMPEADRPRKFDRWSGIWRAWSQWLEQSALEPVQACLLYVLSIPEVDRIVVGIDGMSHLEALLATWMRGLPALPEWPERPPEELLEPSHWSTL